MTIGLDHPHPRCWRRDSFHTIGISWNQRLVGLGLSKCYRFVLLVGSRAEPLVTMDLNERSSVTIWQVDCGPSVSVLASQVPYQN